MRSGQCGPIAANGDQKIGCKFFPDIKSQILPILDLIGDLLLLQDRQNFSQSGLMRSLGVVPRFTRMEFDDDNRALDLHTAPYYCFRHGETSGNSGGLDRKSVV